MTQLLEKKNGDVESLLQKEAASLDKTGSTGSGVESETQFDHQKTSKELVGGDGGGLENGLDHRLEHGMDSNLDSDPHGLDHEPDGGDSSEGGDEGSNGPESHRPNISYSREYLLILVIISAQLMTQASVAQGLSIGREIGLHFNTTDAGQLSWYVAGFSLTAGTFIVSSGRLGEIYGHKNLFVIGYAWLFVFTLIAGISSYSNSSIFFSVCRGLQGLGCAILLPNGLAIFGMLYPAGSRKNIVFALFGAVAPGGFVLGAIFSTLLAKHRWDFTFYVGSIVCFLLTIAAYVIIPNYENKSNHDRQPFDILGALTGIGGLMLFNVAWNQGPVVGWSDPYVYILLILGVLLFVAFGIVETRVSHPLVPVSTMKSSTILILTAVACGWACFGIWLYYTWQLFTVLRQQTPLLAAVEMLPALFGGFLASGAAAFLFPRIPVSVLMAMALVGFCVPSILLATNRVHETYWAASFVATVIAPFGKCFGDLPPAAWALPQTPLCSASQSGLDCGGSNNCVFYVSNFVAGMDISFPAATILLSLSVPKESQGIAASLVATVVNYAISIGLGIAGTVVRYTTPGTDEQSLLNAVRYSAYLGIGLSSLGLIFALIAVWQDRKNLSRPH
ncbi:Amf1p [Sugiyamaella lignohabitans]|uniref:Amf1p n=1 Tax=Sugiyamaella lignohabitans TaxID=796027 RepID=A0A167C1I5_9ASCO|nr:Amf1p [Sugiyamaella lignohabitans]ANB11103.1 Amf1p [Sugiyamaella lignohabitans]